MKKFFLISILLVGNFTINTANAACSGSDCCTINSGVITFPDSDSCAIQPDSYGITIYKMYLCTSAPTAPTALATPGYAAAGCVQTLAATGSSVTITPAGSAQTFSGASFTRPPKGVYTHGVLLIDNVFTIKLDREFDDTLTGIGNGATGKYCATMAGSGNEAAGASMACSSTDNLTAGAWGAILTSFDGAGSFSGSVTATNLNGTGASISGYLVDDSEQLAGARAAVEKLIGIQTFAAPVVITKDFSGLDIAFGINQGSTCWDNGGANIIECGSGPFQAIITPLNY